MAILSNKPATIAKEQEVVVTLSTSELFSAIQSILPDSHWSVSNWERVEFIYKTDSQINRLLFNVHRNDLDDVMLFNEYFLEQNCECKKILIHDKVGDIFTIRRSQFSSLFGSQTLFDVDVIQESIIGTPPTVISITPPANGNYSYYALSGSDPLSRWIGNTLDFVLTFSEDVGIGPSVKVAIRVGQPNVLPGGSDSSIKYASYVDSVDANNGHLFRYTIETPQEVDIDGIEFLGFARIGQVSDYFITKTSEYPEFNLYNPDELSLPFVNTSDILINSESPGVSSVGDDINYSPANLQPLAVYRPNVNFYPLIQVNGDVRIRIQIGSSIKSLPIESVANITQTTTSVTFSYQIQSGDLDTDGIRILDIDLNGGSIKSLSGVDADLSFDPVQTDVTVGTPAPTSQWTLRTTSAGAWNKIIYGLDKFIIVGNNDNIIYSLDGISWSSASFTDSILSGANWRGVCYSSQLNRYVAVADSGTKRVATSSDGITWTLQDASTNATWVSVAYGAGVFSAVNNNTTGSRIMYSSDGFTWSSSGVTTGSVLIGTAYHITYQNGWFLISRENGQINESRVIKSTNGINFTNTLIETASQNPITTEIIYGSSHFVGIANSGILRRSTDTSSWTNASFPTIFGGSTPLSTNSFQGLTYGVRGSTSTSYYYAVSRFRSSSQVMYSTNQGVNWISETITTTTGWNSICYANGIVVAVNNGSGTASNANQRVITFGLT
jgi:hypothetical protein